MGLLAEGDGYRLLDVRCPGGCRGFGPPEQTVYHGLVFIRRGAFVRQADGAEVLLDSTVAYLQQPGTEGRFAHPAGDDTCLAIQLSPGLLASLAGGDPWLAVPALPMDTASELAIRRLMAVALAGDPDGVLAEAVVRTIAGALARAVPRRVGSGLPVVATHERLARQARELLLTDPRLGLVELGRRLGCSPHHLSRVFRQMTGDTVTGYRGQLRVSRALDRLADGETDLSALAHDLGFADHAHLTRTIRATTGDTPTALRAGLTAATAD